MATANNGFVRIYKPNINLNIQTVKFDVSL